MRTRCCDGGGVGCTALLQFVQVAVQWRQLARETLALTGGEHDLVGQRALDQRILLNCLPMVEAALWEGLATGGGAEVGVET